MIKARVVLPPAVAPKGSPAAPPAGPPPKELLVNISFHIT